jgi:hypothetical protein
MASSKKQRERNVWIGAAVLAGLGGIAYFALRSSASAPAIKSSKSAAHSPNLIAGKTVDPTAVAALHNAI